MKDTGSYHDLKELSFDRETWRAAADQQNRAIEDQKIKNNYTYKY